MRTAEEYERYLMWEMRRGSIKAFNTIYELYSKPVFHYCLRLSKSRVSAEELVQDVFVNLWQYHEKINPSLSLSNLVFMIARRYAANLFRLTVNSPVFEDYVDYYNSIGCEDNSKLEYDQFLAHIRRAVSNLPESQRNIVELSRFEGLSNNEVAARLGISEKTVRNQLSIALSKLREKIRKYPGKTNSYD